MFGHLWGTSVTTVSQLSVSNLSGLGTAALRASKRASAIALVVSLAACSTAPEWTKPGLIYGDDAAAASADPSTEQDFPELADVPDKPTPSSTAAERREAAEGLSADRERARYSDEILRGGTEAPAQAPRSAAPAPAPVIATAPVIAPVIAAAPAPMPPTPVASAPAIETGVIPVPSRGGRALPSSATTTAEVPQNRGSETQAVEITPSQPTPVASAPVVSAPVAAPAPVATRVARTPVAPIQPTRSAAVPALPESERVARAQRVESQIDDRLAQIDAASASTQRSVAPVVVATAPVLVAPGTRASDRFEASTAPVLTQEALEAAGPIVSSRYGAPASTTIGSADPEDPVEVNLDALRGIGPGASLRPANGAGVTSTFANQGGPGNIPPYVVSFSHGSVQLNAADRLKVAQAADAVRSQGGVVRVVGHASSRTGDLAVGRHVLANFKASLDRATAVANELIQNGVDPSRVFVEAKSDAVPVYYESMPAGEAGNRRAEIFIE